jgi:hypothetical protein
MAGFPEETDIMIPTPTATMTPMTIHIGETRLRTPVCHRAMVMPTTRTKVPNQEQVNEFHTSSC